MPSTTFSKKGNQTLINFKNTGDLELNDVIHEEVFDLAGADYSFTIQAKSNSWRLGIRLFTSKEIPFSSSARHINEGNVDIQLAVGTWYKPENYWENPNRIELGQYNIESIDHVIDRFDDYKDLSKVEFSIGRDGRDILNVVYKTDKHRASKNIPLPSEHRYFKIFAWADKKDFEINCTVRVKVKGAPKNLTVKPIKPSNKYWFLKLSPDSWSVANLIEGAETWFGTYLPKTGEKRPEYDLFSSVKAGDYALGYAVTNYDAVVCLFKVTQAAHSDQAKGEIISLVVERQISPPIHNTKFREIIDFTNHLGIDSQLRLFPLPPTTFDQILESGKGFNKQREYILPTYSTEGNHVDTEDQLQFTNDIESFATVISLREIKPPLAIGLFGNWGSGKSFFMDKLEHQIQENCASKDLKFAEYIVQVKFNSWHYSDSNLWASLITQIFESLNDYASKKENGKNAIEAIYKKLEITGLQIGETQRKIEETEIEVEKLEEQKNTIEEIVEQKKETLKLWRTGDLISIVFKDPYIRADFENIKEQFKSEALIDDLNELDARMSEVTTAGDRIIKSFQLFRKNRKGNWWIVWLVFLVALAGIYLITGPYDFILNYAVNQFTRIIATVVFVTAGITKLYPYFRKVSLFYRRLRSLKETIEKEKQGVRIKEQDEITKLAMEIEKLESKKEMLEKEKVSKVKDKEMLENQLTDIGSGKLLANFLAGRSTDDNYIKQLGIISWIRKDFSRLNELFVLQEKVKKDQAVTPVDGIKIDRIVLYIDDLDRCNEDTVVKVLEAIHLLLAFPLFVVVVGVDPRWLDNALNEKYKTLFGKKTGETSGTGNEIPVIHYDRPASSYDYLEKIFQIPFSLKPINKEGREDLLSYLVKNEMKTPESYAEKSQSSGALVTTEEQVDSNSLSDADTNIPVSPANPVGAKEEEVDKISRLVFLPQELQFMQDISALFGHTPRTINRYVNIYRIIKAHKSFNPEGIFTENEFRAVMLGLAIIVGYPEDAGQFIREIHKSKDKSMTEFLKRDHVSTSLSQFIKINIRQQVLSSITPTMIRKNLDLIARFSFRPIQLEE